MTPEQKKLIRPNLLKVAAYLDAAVKQLVPVVYDAQQGVAGDHDVVDLDQALSSITKVEKVLYRLLDR